MDSWQVNDRNPLQLGEEWIRALIEKDFQRLAGICHPDVHSRLMTPNRMDTLENASDLTRKVEGWFQKYSSIQTEQARVAMVGGKLGIFYRLRVEENNASSTIEQQLYCSLLDGLIEKLSLLCSGFQPVQPAVEAPTPQAVNSGKISRPSTDQSSLQAHALLEIAAAGGQESTCAILTPSIKRKLGEISSGQVLEVHVDDPSAKGDIEAWCRLSGNTLLQMDQGSGQELRFYLMKK